MPSQKGAQSCHISARELFNFRATVREYHTTSLLSLSLIFYITLKSKNDPWIVKIDFKKGQASKSLIQKVALNEFIGMSMAQSKDNLMSKIAFKTIHGTKTNLKIINYLHQPRVKPTSIQKKPNNINRIPPFHPFISTHS